MLQINKDHSRAKALLQKSRQYRLDLETVQVRLRDSTTMSIKNKSVISKLFCIKKICDIQIILCTKLLHINHPFFNLFGFFLGRKKSREPRRPYQTSKLPLGKTIILILAQLSCFIAMILFSWIFLRFEFISFASVTSL